jgi:hypothetical protein
VQADGTRCAIKDAVQLNVGLVNFSWDHEFKILNGGPFLFIFRLDFLRKTAMVVDAASHSFSFRFASQCVTRFGRGLVEQGGDQFFHNLFTEVLEDNSKTTCSVGVESCVEEFSGAVLSDFGDCQVRTV